MSELKSQTGSTIQSPLLIPAEGHNTEAPQMVLLSGLGFSGQVFSSLAEFLTPDFNLIVPDLPGFGANHPLDVRDEDQLLELLLPLLPAKATYFGWSLGGMLAIRLAALYPERLEALILCSANPSFVARPGWDTSGLDQQQFRRFESILERNDWRIARRRLCALSAKGEQSESEQRYQLLQACSQEPSSSAVAVGVEMLRDNDLRAELKNLSVPVLHILGGRDALVPSAALSDSLYQLQSSQRVVVLPKSGHAPFLARAVTVASLIRCFTTDHLILPQLSSQRLDSRRVARSFSGAASDYDNVALLQREVGYRLMDDLPASTYRQMKRVIDLGCGTGFFLPELRKRCPQAALTAIDLALGMVKLSRKNSPDVGYCCGAAEQLPIANNQMNLIFSNLTLQWCDDPGQVLREIQRVLAPGGYFIFSTFAPETLWELRSAWRAADEYVHVHQFVPPIIWQCVADDLGLCWLDFRLERQLRYYADMKSLLLELKTLGAHNSSRSARQGLTTPRQLRVAEATYEDLRTEAGLPATYQLLYGVLQKP